MMKVFASRRANWELLCTPVEPVCLQVSGKEIMQQFDQMSMGDGCPFNRLCMGLPMDGL
jgi:hypothetical protein